MKRKIKLIGIFTFSLFLISAGVYDVLVNKDIVGYALIFIPFVGAAIALLLRKKFRRVN